eukprot:gb/GFBE01025469.1/.p1 GENE.gb/GFBE01025469.1/~~gb/GFBE01025469.1/.p1  ORF type:complete len:211 (+),score=41.66 gb/GFBE01025469.1/:1-633(+)
MRQQGLAALGGVLGAFALLSGVLKAPSDGFVGVRQSRSPASRAILVGRKVGKDMKYGLLMPAPASFPEDVYAAAKQERDNIVEGLDEGELVFERELQELPRASMLAQQLSQIYDVDVMICIHPMEHTPLSEESESTALGRQFFRVREALKSTARGVNVPMMIHAAVCDSNFLEVMKGSSYFKDVTKATVEDAVLLAAVRREAAKKGGKKR